MKLTAVTNKVFIVLVLLSGCSYDPTPSNKAVAPPITKASAVSDLPPASIEPAASGDLRINRVKHNNGFSFPLHISEGVNGFVAQTLPAPHDHNLVAHLVRRITDEAEGKRFQLDIVTIKPKAEEYRVFPVADVIVQDDYSVDSIARAYGYNDDDQLVLVQPKERDDGQKGVQYNVVSIDLYTGRIQNIAADAVPDVSPTFFAKGWMNDSGQLYLNSYSDGRMWSVDTRSGQVREFEGSFKNEWPLYLLTASPNGNLFWHEEDEGFRLYNRNGELLKVIPQTLGFHAYPAFEWSPDSRYAALAFTLSDSQGNVLGGEEAYLIAPEAVAFYDESGNLTWDVQAKPKEGLTNVDWNGWLAEGDEGVLSWYRLERSEEGEAPRKADLSYALANVTTGKVTELTQAEQLEELKLPVPVVNKSDQLLFIDREEGLYWLPGEAAQAIYYQLLSKPTDAQLVWSMYDFDTGKTTVTRYNPATHAAFATVLEDQLGYELQLIDDTLIVDNKMNYRWIHEIK
ncbi:hypothetical protein M3194_16390 [Paenibacillus glycanilyticus]|uniref:TolB family protein n=1 Tax=Paenibacillus glycanilyticus TaxID=126569 RepID=UPI00203B93B2|nr:hypothetical protein [Paenibacillus glycanilyticus]MCM3628925.1 hypothetical protein [Paenibacillus glycanilyticus]